MPDKLTDNEIVKALECCAVPLPKFKCDECPAWVNSHCTLKTEDTIYLINRLQAENERLKEGLPMSASFLFEKAKLDELLTRTVEAETKFKNKIKAEAYKECIEKVMSKSIYNPMGMFYIVPEEWLKELVGEDK